MQKWFGTPQPWRAIVRVALASFLLSQLMSEPEPLGLDSSISGCMIKKGLPGYEAYYAT
jgi:hypothetical protein